MFVIIIHFLSANTNIVIYQIVKISLKNTFNHY